jgi:hypothetical protein
MNIGVIGIGAFGSRVALRLLWSGYHTLQIYDVVDVATRLFTNDYGGMAMGSPKMMAQTCDVVIAVLPSAAELREVCFGWEGLAQGFGTGGILIDLGNTDPVETVNIANELAAGGVDLVAAPAFGTPAQAKEGRLTLVVGGPQAAIARCRPVLDTIAAKILQADACQASSRPRSRSPSPRLRGARRRPDGADTCVVGWAKAAAKQPLIAGPGPAFAHAVPPLVSKDDPSAWAKSPDDSVFVARACSDFAHPTRCGVCLIC